MKPSVNSEGFFLLGFLRKGDVTLATNKISKIDIELPKLLAELKATNKTKVVVLDTESVVGSHLIFDFAYNIIDPFKSIKGETKGTLVYEALKDDYLISIISKWKKVKDATIDSTYGFYQKLLDEGWYSQEFSTPDIEKQALDVARTKAEEQYIKQTNIVKDLKWRQAWWEPDSGRRAKGWIPGPVSISRLSQARVRTDRAVQIETTLRRFIETGHNLDEVMKQRLLGKNNTLNSIKQKIYYTLYNEQKKTITKEELRADLQLFQRLEFNQPVKPWLDIISSFDDDVSKQDILAVTAYNIGADKNFIKKTSNTYGASRYANVLDKYQQICMQNMYKRLKEIPAQDVYNLLKKNDRQAIEEGYRDALLNSTKSTNSVSFEVAYATEMNIDEFKTTHSAAGDVDDESDFLIEVVQKYLVERL